ncbi:MAG: M12 family metallopeptidase [Byssovorax sp.]
MSRPAFLALVILAAGCGSSPAPRSAAFNGRPPPPETYRAPASAPGSQASSFIFLPGAARARQVNYQVHGGMAVYQGDIMLGPAQLVPIIYARPRAEADGRSYAAASSKANRWPNGEMPYEIDATVTPQKRAMIDWAVSHIGSQSVLKPRPRTPADGDYLVFTEAAGQYGCSSYVGRVGGPQLVRVGGCGVAGSVVHEICHAAGLYHEQSRTDRDNYVTIQWSEISPGEEAQFTIDGDTMDIGAYDYGSIMHYSRAAFSRSGNDTIVPKDPRVTIGQREGLSVNDKAALAQLYTGVGPGPSLGAPPGMPSTISLPGMPPIPLPSMPGGTSVPGWPASLPGLPGWPSAPPSAPAGSGSPPALPALPAGFPTSLPAGLPSSLPPLPQLP